MLVAGLVLAVMILPIVSAVAREVFSQTPRKLQEGALALGATRWEMIRMTVLPFGKSSVISGAMLGLGRALGETMAVTIILSVSGVVTFNLISQANPSTIAANIALDFPESSGLAVNALIASGLVLFAITLVTNMIARAVIARQNVRVDGGAAPTTATPPAPEAAARRQRSRTGRPTASSPARSRSRRWSCSRRHLSASRCCSSSPRSSPASRSTPGRARSRARGAPRTG